MTVRIIDIETTGTDPEKDRIVEIASVDAKRDNAPPDEFRTHLVDPGVPIPAIASAVHHLVDADVRGKPGLDQVIDAHRGADLYVAHNAAFERGFLDPYLGHDTKWLCTYRAAVRLWPDLPSHSNQFLRYHFGYVQPYSLPADKLVPHRALADCFVTACVLAEVLREANEHEVPVSELVAWSAEPPLKSLITFGKLHKGKKYADVPADYLEWIRDKSDMDADTKWCADYWLRARKQIAA